MTLWLFFLLATFVLSSASWRKPMGARVRLVAILCLLASFGYYVFHLL